MTQKQPESRLARTLFAALLCGAGLGLTLCQSRECFEFWKSREWHATPGIIVTSQYQQVPARLFYFFGPPVSTGQRCGKHVIRYRYLVNDKRYDNERIAFGEIGALRYVQSDWSRLFAKYPPRDRVTVFYDPTHPQRAVIDPHVRREGIVALGVGVFLLVMGGGIFAGLDRTSPATHVG